jgi:iron(III) transport system substrate-binding protein
MVQSDAKPVTVEGALVVYSAAEKQYCAGLLGGFSERHPRVPVDFQFGISVALNERYLAELAANSPRADVVWSSAMDLQMGLVLAGGALRYRSPEAHAYPDGAVYRDMAYLTTLEPLVTLVNRDRFDVRTPAGSLAELAAAVRSDLGRFRGRVACYDIERNGLGFLALLHESRRGADFDAFLDALAACQPKVFGSNPALIDEVASGRAALACHVLASYALRAVKTNPSLAIAVSNATPLAVSRVAFIPQRAPHPSAAKLFIDYLLSRDGQQQLLEAGLFPIRQDVRSQTGFDAHELAPIRIDQGFEELLDERRRRELLRQWRTAVAGAAAASEISITRGRP